MTATGAAWSGASAPGGPARAQPDPYAIFCATVALRQLTEWTPLATGGPLSILDVSLPLADAAGEADHRVSDILMAAGHRVTTVVRSPAEIRTSTARLNPVVVADPRGLDWIRGASLDIVVAEGAALSECLAAEDTLRDVARVLRPGGRLLASAYSLVLGLAQLAEQHRWSELADAPAADVVLVPNREAVGGYTRCFGPEDLTELLTDAGLEVEWIRPRTVLPAAAIRETLLADPAALGDLVMSELRLTAAHEGEAHGAQLLVSGRKPGLIDRSD